jgi:hypothetical protein
MNRQVFLLSVLWFNGLVGSTVLIALGTWMAFSSGVEIGPGPSEPISSSLRYVAGSLAILIVVGLALFRSRLFSVDAMSQLEIGSKLDLGDADPVVKRAAAQLGSRMFIAVGVSDIPALVLIGIGLMENAMEPFLLAVAYVVVVSLVFRPPIRPLMEALVARQLDKT